MWIVHKRMTKLFPVLVIVAFIMIDIINLFFVFNFVVYSMTNNSSQSSPVS